MLQGISRFCSRYSWLVIVVVVVVTVVFVRQIREKSYFEADMTKFLPPDMSAVKSDDYYKKNFNYQDMLLIAVEKRSGSIMEPSVLRAIEKISLDIKRLKASKTFQSRLMGKTVTLNQSVGMDPDSINSVAVLEDAILDRRTDSVVSGSVVEKLKSDNGIASAPGREERLPESDEDLRKIIPALQSRVLDDKTFRGSLLSEDLKAATIRAAMVRRWSYKKRYAEIEITTAIDGKRLKDRFSGKDSTFPFEIYGKTLDGISIDDEYIRRHSTQLRKRLHQWLVDYFEDTFEAEPVLKDLLTGEFTEERFLAVLKYQQRKDFYLVSDIGTWSNFINDLYSFTLERIDPFSRENLEFQLHDVENIYSLAKVYYLIQDVLGKHSVPGVKYYIAGAPLVFGVVADMMPKDMSTMVPIALAIILAVLLVSFRSLRGIVIPTITVVLAVIWSLGLMASLGIPFTVTTNILPIVLLAVGSAYSIHLLNRFYEDAANVDNGGDRRKIVVTSVSKVGVAVFMAGVTTIAGFSSLATADLTPIKHFGAFSAVGVAVALLLTLTLTPAILTIWKAPKNRNLKAHGNPGEKTDWVSRIMRRWANLVIAYPKVIVVSLTILVVASLSLMSRNYFEGGMMSNFKKNNPIYVSDRFLAKNLTGTTNINLLFEFRDRILLEDENARNDFLKRIDGFAESWKQWLQKTPEKSNPRFSKLEELLRKEGKGLPGGLDTVVERIRLIRNMLDEEYMLEVASTGEESSDEMNGEFSSESGDGDTGELDELDGDDGELDGLSETGSEEDDLSQPAGAFADLSKEQIAGLKDIIQRLEVGEENWEEVGKAVLRLREDKASPSGLRMQHDLNYLQDFLALDIKQPTVLHKLEQLYAYLKGLESPEVVIDGRVYPPTGLVVSPVDMVSKFYRVFYHDDNYAFNKLPDVAADGFEDERLTDRTIIGVLLNQALSSNRDDFEAMITPNLKEFQMQAMIRDDSGKTVDAYVETALDKVAQLFPKNDPYIKTVRVGGQAPTSVQMTRLIGKSQLRSIVLSFLFVFVVTFFIFRSALGGLYSLIPLGFTVILNFGLLALLGGQITMPIMLVASIAIGTGVDYTIHFLERMKIQLREGDTLHEAYIATVLTSGKAIMLNALAVALGFLVLLASRFVPPTMMGVLMAATMMFSSLGALTLLPALIFLTKPSFLEKSKLGK